jgi:hypothetical protein
MVVAVAMDARPDAARPWIEAARPTYRCLIDRDHRVAELYHMVNVPQAVWIDETGRIVRPTESAGAYEGFRAMDRATRKVPDEVAVVTAQAKRTYVDAVRDWVLRGPASAHAFDPAQAIARLVLPDERVALAHAHFRLGQHLLRQGKEGEADEQFREARRLHPDSWNIWRQTAGIDARGLASGPEFWARVDALGSRRYYAPVDMEGMPD